MPYLYNDDKSILPLEETMDLIWRGAHEATTGFSIDLDDLGFDRTKYRFLYIVFENTAGNIDATCLMPIWDSSADHLGDPVLDTFYTYTVNNVVTYVYERFIRHTFYDPARNYISFDNCMHRKELSDNNYDSVEFSFAPTRVIPYEILGVR